MQMLDHTAVALYDRLTSDQLRDLLSAYLGAEKSKSLPQKSREQLIASLNSGSDPHLLAILAHRIELVSPYKHCFPYTLDPQQNLDLRKIVEIHKGKLPSLERTFARLGSGIRAIEPQMYLVDKENEVRLTEYRCQAVRMFFQGLGAFPCGFRLSFGGLDSAGDQVCRESSVCMAKRVQSCGQGWPTNVDRSRYSGWQ